MFVPVSPAEFALLLLGRLTSGLAAPMAAPMALEAMDTAELEGSEEVPPPSGASRRRRGGGQVNALEGMSRRWAVPLSVTMAILSPFGFAQATSTILATVIREN